MKRLILAVSVLAPIAAGFWLLQGDRTDMTLSGGKATPVGSGGMFMASLDIVNDGPPDRLLSVSSPSALHVGLMNPGHGPDPIVVPGGGQAQLAMDGAHLMVRAAPETFEEGGFLPVTLSFEKAGDVAVRLLNSGPTAMDHSAPGIEISPAPQVTLEWITPPSATGGQVRVTFTNIDVKRVPEDTGHVPGEGHAHAYLNGLKLGRVYGDTLEIGTLMPGAYTLALSVNTHDHRPYVADGQPVQATLTFTIPG